MSRVLVTGAGGFLGRHCLGRLAALGFEVHAVSSRTGPGEAGAWHRCDLLDAVAAEALVERLRPTHLLHLAWIATPGVFWSSPANRAWLEAGERLVQRFFARGGRRALGVGSCAEYAPTEAPCREDATPVAPATEYGRAKAAMCAALERAAAGAGSWAWARLFFPYGPGEPAGRFLPDLIDALLEGRAIACTHGNQVRDFVYAGDAAEAFAALLGSNACGAFNVGSGEGRSLREAAATVSARLGGSDLVRFGERAAPAWDPPRIVADTARLRAATGWRPRTAFDEGIRLTIEARRAARSMTT